jgi:serine phosphatase RsbU (regulator of sigma subunit)
MPVFVKQFLIFIQRSLSWRIVFWVFISVIVIEAIILIPSFKNREKELLTQTKDVSAAKISMIMQLLPENNSAQDLARQIQKIQLGSHVVGGSLYRSDGKPIEIFGKAPQFIASQSGSDGLAFVKSENGDYYDLLYSPEQFKRGYTLILRHDASPIRRELYAFTLRIGWLVVIISIFVTAGAWIALNPIVVKPILRLRGDLVKAGETIRQDQHTPEFDSASIQRQDELGEVIEAFRQMYSQVTDAISEQKRAEKALQESFEQVDAYSKALNRELEKGRQMQTNFLPAQLLSKPGWEFAAYFKPARQVAGDFYDLFELPDNKVGIVIADVCDKGVGAALFMALFRSLIRIFSGQTAVQGAACLVGDDSPTVVNVNPENEASCPDRVVALKTVQFTNKYIALNHGELAMFATLFMGVLDPSTGIITYVNGGHEPLLIVESSGAVTNRLNPTGPAVGIEPDVPFEIREVKLQPGEILLGYTDGIIEARSKSGEFFSFKHLVSLLQDGVGPADALLDHIAARVKTHTGDAEQYDDITLLAIRRLTRQQ